MMMRMRSGSTSWAFFTGLYDHLWRLRLGDDEF